MEERGIAPRLLNSELLTFDGIQCHFHGTSFAFSFFCCSLLNPFRKQHLPTEKGSFKLQFLQLSPAVRYSLTPVKKVKFTVLILSGPRDLYWYSVCRPDKSFPKIQKGLHMVFAELLEFLF